MSDMNSQQIQEKQDNAQNSLYLVQPILKQFDFKFNMGHQNASQMILQQQGYQPIPIYQNQIQHQLFNLQHHSHMSMPVYLQQQNNLGQFFSNNISNYQQRSDIPIMLQSFIPSYVQPNDFLTTPINESTRSMHYCNPDYNSVMPQQYINFSNVNEFTGSVSNDFKRTIKSSLSDNVNFQKIISLQVLKQEEDQVLEIIKNEEQIVCEAIYNTNGLQARFNDKSFIHVQSHNKQVNMNHSLTNLDFPQGCIEPKEENNQDPEKENNKEDLRLFQSHSPSKNSEEVLKMITTTEIKFQEHNCTRNQIQCDTSKAEVPVNSEGQYMLKGSNNNDNFSAQGQLLPEPNSRLPFVNQKVVTRSNNYIRGSIQRKEGSVDQSQKFRSINHGGRQSKKAKKPLNAESFKDSLMLKRRSGLSVSTILNSINDDELKEQKDEGDGTKSVDNIGKIESMKQLKPDSCIQNVAQIIKQDNEKSKPKPSRNNKKSASHEQIQSDYKLMEATDTLKSRQARFVQRQNRVSVAESQIYSGTNAVAIAVPHKEKKTVQVRGGYTIQMDDKSGSTEEERERLILEYYKNEAKNKDEPDDHISSDWSISSLKLTIFQNIMKNIIRRYIQWCQTDCSDTDFLRFFPSLFNDNKPVKSGRNEVFQIAKAKHYKLDQLRRMMIHLRYSIVFEHYLKQPALQWLEKSKVSNKQQIFNFINEILKEFNRINKQVELRQILHSKKRDFSTCIEYSILFPLDCQDPKLRECDQQVNEDESYSKSEQAGKHFLKVEEQDFCKQATKIISDGENKQLKMVENTGVQQSDITFCKMRKDEAKQP